MRIPTRFLWASFALLFWLAPLAVHGATLRFMTYNIHHGVGEDNALNLSRIASVITAANPDVVSLQEVDNGVPRSNSVNQVARLAELTGMQWYFGKARNLDGGAYGNGVLVRQGIDIVSTQNHALPNPDNTEVRAVAQLGLSLDSNPATAEFHFFATHFAHDSPAGRQESATFINGLVSSSSVPAILAGDMNFNPGSTAFNIIDNQWTDATNVANPGINRANQIDYVFYRQPSQWNIVTAGQFIRNATTEVASDHYPLLAVLELDHVWPGSALVWNVNTGVSTAFNAGFATGNGSAGVGDFPANPFGSLYNTGQQNLIVGYNGNGTVSGNVDRTIGSMRIGTNQANSIIAGRNGNGAVSASGSMGLLIASTAETTGDLLIGEGGFTGAMNWNGSGTLEVQGKLRVGQSGTGTLTQANGVVIAGNTAGGFKFIGIGVDSGSTGTYNLDGGTFRPSGGFDGTQFRQVLVGDNGGTGTLNVGNDAGASDTAVIEANDDLIVGRGGGTGTLRIRNDGRVELRTSSNAAQLIVGNNGAGTVYQTGGSVITDDLVMIGGGASGNGQYFLSGGSFTSGIDGVAQFAIGQNGATGLMRISGSASFSHASRFYIANEAGTGSTGRLEIVGSQASVSVSQLVNDDGGTQGLNETLRWEADANGITSLVVTGAGSVVGSRVQLQSTTDLAANTTASGNITGDGLAMELNLASLAASTQLMLINNVSAGPVQGLFERATSQNLYEEGSSVAATGFRGLVNISYVGGDGNDVVLQLTSATDLGDFNDDGTVDAADYVVWSKTGVGGAQGYENWRTHFGLTWLQSGSGSGQSGEVPEPAAFTSLVALLGAFSLHRRSKRRAVE